MKHLHITLFIAFTFIINTYNAQAQSPPDSSSGLQEVIEWIYAPLDTSQHISTGLLMDKGLMDSSFFWHRGKDI